MGTNQTFAQGGSVTLKSGQSYNLSPAEMELRKKNLQNQGIDPNTTTPQSTGGAISSSGSQSGETTDTTEQENKVVDSQAQIDNELLDAQRDAYEYNKNLEGTITENYEGNINDIEKTKTDRINTAEDYYSNNQKILDEQNKQLAEIEQSQIDAYQQRIDRDTLLLEEKKASDVAVLRAQQEKQRIENENTIRQAKVNIEIEKQQSAWAYNKIGLGFSSGIINQSQQIATDGIAKIAEIKATMNFQEVQINAQIAQVEFDYANLVNKTIDTYTDNITAIQKEMKNRISESAQNMLKNNYEKRQDLDAIEDWAREEKRNAERQHIEDIQAVKDKGIQYLEDIQAGVERYQAKELAKLDTMLQNGTITSLTDAQIAQKEIELGLPAGTINAQINMGINQEIRSLFDQIAGEGRIIGDISNMTEEVKREMKLGRSYVDAVNIVMEREIERNPDLQKAIDNNNAPSLDELKYGLDLEKFKYSQMKDYNDLNFDYAKLQEDARQFDAENTGSEVGFSSFQSAGTAPNGMALKRTVQPSGEVTTVNFPSLQGKDVVLDSVAGQSLQGVLDQDIFKGVIVGSAYRNSEEQKALYEAYQNGTGGLASKPGTSAHESGMALDLYSDADYNPLTEEQVKALNEAGWYQNAGESDLGHFEYVGNQDTEDERAILASKAIELGLDRKDVPLVKDEDLASFIIRNSGTNKRGSVSDATQPLLTQLENKVNETNAKMAYEALLKDGFTKDEALAQIGLLKEITVKDGIIYDKDLFFDDPIFNTNTN